MDGSAAAATPIRVPIGATRSSLVHNTSMQLVTFKPQRTQGKDSYGIAHGLSRLVVYVSGGAKPNRKHDGRR
jgi:hypothetical protein